MPLATGRSALAALTTTVGVLQLLAFGPMFIPEIPDWVPRWVGGVIVIVLGLLWAVWLFAVVGSLMAAWKRRSSDVRISPWGIEVQGGPANGLRVPWARVTSEATATEVDGAPGGLLHIQGKVVAESSEEDELRSFQALADTLAVSGRERPEPPASGSPRVLSCESCGAPVAPSPEPRVSCRHCQSPVDVPAEVRSRFVDAGTLRDARDRAERLLRSLLRQPGARFTNLVLAVAAAPLLLGFPLTAIAFNELFVTRHILRPWHSIWLFSFASAFSLGLYLWLRAQVSGREAIRVLTFRYGARRDPPAPGFEAPGWSCRVCGASLTLAGEPEDHVVVLCRYCQAENITGIELRRDADDSVAHTSGLETELRARLARRRSWRLASAVALLLLAVSGGALAKAFPRTCRDGVRDGEETDVDCGGRCTRCGDDRGCAVDLDCSSKRCVAGKCAAPACADGVKNGQESDVDCGGTCPGCAPGMFCTKGPDCASGHCGLSGTCD
jgi:hypothetical protein